MTLEYSYFDDTAREEIERRVLDARTALKDAGFKFHGPRFPFAMHHAAYRNKLPRLGRRLHTHFQIAGLLNTWAVQRSSPRDYVAQAVHGALMSISDGKYDPVSVPEGVRRDLESISEGKDFEVWVSARHKTRNGSLTGDHR
jgi:hypothetical protein